MIGTDIAIDLGTSRFKVYLDGKGIVISEPSIIAVDNLTDEVIAIGSDAYDMLGRTSDRITVSRPLSNGVISDFSMAEQLISHYLRQIAPSRVFMPRVVVSVPCNVTEVEKRAVVPNDPTYRPSDKKGYSSYWTVPQSCKELFDCIPMPV